jgi:hypothetical protein
MSQDPVELLLTGVKDQAQRKQITSAYYEFAKGDPETFAVQFAVLLRAHAMSLKLLSARRRAIGKAIDSVGSPERYLGLYRRVANDADSSGNLLDLFA